MIDLIAVSKNIKKKLGISDPPLPQKIQSDADYSENENPELSPESESNLDADIEFFPSIKKEFPRIYKKASESGNPLCNGIECDKVSYKDKGGLLPALWCSQKDCAVIDLKRCPEKLWNRKQSEFEISTKRGGLFCIESNCPKANYQDSILCCYESDCEVFMLADCPNGFWDKEEIKEAVSDSFEPVQCGGCVNFICDKMNPKAGLGHCRIKDFWAYPFKKHGCKIFNDDLGDLLSDENLEDKNLQNLHIKKPDAEKKTCLACSEYEFDEKADHGLGRCKLKNVWTSPTQNLKSILRAFLSMRHIKICLVCFKRLKRDYREPLKSVKICKHLLHFSKI